MSSANSELAKSINLILLWTKIIFKISVLPSEGSGRLLFFHEGISNCLTSLALFACSLNYNACSLAAFKHKDHDYHTLPGGRELSLWIKELSLSTLFEPPATIKRQSLLIFPANVNHVIYVYRWKDFSPEMFILSLYQWMILPFGSLLQRAPFTKLWVLSEIGFVDL